MHEFISSDPAGACESARRIKSICVYCGSGAGVEPAYEVAARTLASPSPGAGIGLVYGGGGNGLMGAIARAALSAGGAVTGIIPDFLHRQRQASARNSGNHHRPGHAYAKRLMFERADAFVALPGGIGTLEELVEQLTWVQLERHTKPVVIADIDGFWQPLLDLFAHMRERRFIQPSFEVRYLVAEKIEDVVPMIETAAARNDLLGVRRETIDPRL